MATTPVQQHGGAPARGDARPGVVTAAVVVALWMGLGNIFDGLGHIQGVVGTATTRGYPYDFRYAGLLLVGIMIVYSGVLFLWAVRGLARGERPAWDRALSGTILLLLVAVPLIPVEPDNAILQALVPGTVSLFVLLAARPRLGTYTHSAALGMQPSAAGRPQCGRCGQVLSPFWRERCGVCKAPFSEFPPVGARGVEKSSERVAAAMEQRGARIWGMAGALVVAGFALIVVFGHPSSAPAAAGIGIVYLMAAAAIRLAPRRWAAWVATASTVPTALLTLVGFANYLPDGLVLLTATFLQGRAALALHRDHAKRTLRPPDERVMVDS